MAQIKPKAIDTQVFAAEAGVSPATIRTHLCRHGHFHGIQPKARIGGRLFWSSDAAEKLLQNTPYLK